MRRTEPARLIAAVTRPAPPTAWAARPVMASGSQGATATTAVPAATRTALSRSVVPRAATPEQARHQGRSDGHRPGEDRDRPAELLADVDRDLVGRTADGLRHVLEAFGDTSIK
ncbi:hypothetical protein ACIOMM_22285 [Streptomyces sp. NPDC087908]|uniref:hypothetical protein n=1 Tax=Streptomyces sp. NPDC087908 TaxID=3365820 RepID=UPI003817FACC